MDELKRQQSGSQEDKPSEDLSKDLFDKVYKLWEDGESQRETIQKYYDYWDGKIANAMFDDMPKTPINVIKQILEAKLANMLDAQFTVGVNPKLNTYSSIETLKDHQAIADIYNDEMINVLNANKWDMLQEIIGRWGMMKFGASQVSWDDSDRVEGEIKIEDIDPRNLRWNKGARKFKELTFLSYISELNPGKVKAQYAKPNGSWDLEMCQKIDDLAETQTNIVKGEQKGVVNVQTDQTTSQAFVYDSKGITAGKIVKLIVMYLLDDSLYSPDKVDSPEEAGEKQTLEKKYPNGRMIIFSESKEKRMVFEDRPISESFKGLGNIDLFNSMIFDEVVGKGDMEPLIAIQDRINGGIQSIRHILKGHIHKLGVDKAKFPELTENAFVDFDVIFAEGLAGEKLQDGIPSIINDVMPDVAAIWEQIKMWKQEAYDVARVNPTMLTGYRQAGTNSAEQVEALQESPMITIRGLQRNFKSYTIGLGEKIVSLIQNNYNVDRLINCSTGVQGAKVAKISITHGPVGKDGKPVEGREMVLYNEAMEEVKRLKIDPNWQYSVEVSAGTDVPRSRRELASLTEKNFKDGVLGDINDIDVREQYLRAQDYPNWRAFVALARKKQEEMAKAQPVYPKIDKILNDEILAKSFSELVTALAKAGFSTDVAALLKLTDLTGKVNNMASVPIEQITSRSQISDVATIMPEKISDVPEKNASGSETAQADKIIKQLSPEQLGMALQFLTHLVDTQGGVNG